jgi:KAP family P-loop domain
MDGDKPVTRPEDDRLGFAPVARHLAGAIVGLPAAAGFVFGIEGRWGSGKSTLIALTKTALQSRGADAPETIDFSPWLVGNREDLLRSMLAELASAAIRIDPIEEQSARDPPSKLLQREQFKKDIKGKLEKFGAIAGGLGKLAKLADAVGIPAAGLVATALDRGGDAANAILGSPPISEEKAYLVGALAQLSRRIVVFIDDLDRLEPQEACEVLRLVRAVADFPNVIYVLSYDPDVLAQTLTQSIQVEDGGAYLEKIVQVSFRVPRPEAFDLRRWFQTEVRKLFVEELVGASFGDRRAVAPRLARVIDVYGGRYLETGRDVVRVLNALRLHAIPVRHKIDVADMVWLQLAKIGDPQFYNWIEEYLVEAAAIANGASASGWGAMAERLERTLKGHTSNIVYAVVELSEILPGITTDNDQIVLFKDLRGASIDELAASRRLGSPHHYRYYFAFEIPAGSVPDEQIVAFITTAEKSPQDAVQLFVNWGQVERPQGGTLADVVIDRVAGWSNRIPIKAVPGIVNALAQMMDFPTLSMMADLGRHPSWELATRAVRGLLSRVTGDIRASSLRALFVEGAALGWLSEILRREMFSHGRFGDRPDPPERRLLSETELEEVLSIMLKRYRETDLGQLMAVPDLLNLLFAWLEGGGEDEPRKWVSERIITDKGFVDLLSRLRTWAAVNDIIYYPLKRANVEPFLDFDEAVRRLDNIISSSTARPSATERQLALELREAVQQGERPERVIGG